MRLLLCFLNCGPYHLARLRACGPEVAGLQLAAAQSEYGWETKADERLATVFAGRLEEVQPRQWEALVSSALDRIGPEVCAVAGYGHPGMRAILSWCLRRRRPIVLMSDSRAEDGPRRAGKEWIKRRIVRACSAGFVAGRPHVNYLESLGMAREKIFTGYDVVDNAHFTRGAAAARADASAVRLRHGLPENYFLACARFVEKKNLFRVMAAYANYRKSSPAAAWPLVLIGDGPLRGEILRRLAELQLNQFVTLPGFVSYGALPVYYGLGAVFIHAAQQEQWALVVNEAMAAGLPVLVSTDCGCATDLVQPEINGFTFDPASIEQLAGLMQKMASLPEVQRAAMGRAGREIISRWDLSRFAQGLRAAAEMALAAPPPKASITARFLLWLLRWQPSVRNPPPS